MGIRSNRNRLLSGPEVAYLRLAILIDLVGATALLISSILDPVWWKFVILLMVISWPIIGLSDSWKRQLRGRHNS